MADARVRFLNLAVLMAASSACVTRQTYEACLAARQNEAYAAHGRDVSAQAELASLRGQTQNDESALASQSANDHNLRASLDEATAMNQELRGELGRLGQNVDAILKEKGTMATALADAKARLAELRKVQTAAEARATAVTEIGTRFATEINAKTMRVATRHGRVVILCANDAFLSKTSTDLTKRLAAALSAVPATTSRRFEVTARADLSKLPKASYERAGARAAALAERLIAGGMKPELLVVSAAAAEDANDANVIEIALEPADESAAP